jgi:hypothetical protein
MKSTLLAMLAAVAALLGSLQASAALSPDPGVYMMPMNCAELLPDPAPYLNFFGAVARGSVTSDRKFSRKLFRVLALREKLQDYVEKNRGQNPIDVLIQKTVCFYRQQKEPLKPVSSDDPVFVDFLKTSLTDLDGKVDDAVFSMELERQQRQEYERLAQKNRGAVQLLEDEADRDADATFEKLSKAARRKVKLPQ